MAARRFLGGVVALAAAGCGDGDPQASKPTPTATPDAVQEALDIAAAGPPDVTGTLAHEMTHTALQPDTSARAPPWLIEGVAMHVEGDRGLGPRAPLSAISRPGSIFRLRGSEQGAAYAAAAAAAAAIVDRHGNEGLFRLYKAFNEKRIPGRPGARTTDRVLRRTLGMRLSELQSAIG